MNLLRNERRAICPNYRPLFNTFPLFASRQDPRHCFVVWKASRWFTKMEDQIERLLSNHLEHAQDSLDKLNAGQNAALTEMKELRADLRELLRR